MKILVTGAKGFVGKNISHELINQQFEVLPIDIDDNEETLSSYINEADFVVHLAGANRPLTTEEFYSGNANFTFKLCELLKKENRQIPIIFSSTIQAAKDNDYGKSKKMAEDYLIDFGKNNKCPVYIYRLSNVFGKWCRPNYNSVVATFCHNITHDLPITINDENALITFVYIDDIVKEFIDVIKGFVKVDVASQYLEVRPLYEVTLGKLAQLLYKFKESRKTLNVADTSGGFETKLYATYLSYIEPTDYAYELKMNVDNRGSFTEFIKTASAGQYSINVAHPGIAKGQHWHHSKNEKFLVVAGKAIIKLRQIDSEEIYEYIVSGEKLTVVDIPVGYTHSITNIGDVDLVTVMWASESFNKDKPDTYFLEV